MNGAGTQIGYSPNGPGEYQSGCQSGNKGQRPALGESPLIPHCPSGGRNGPSFGAGSWGRSSWRPPTRSWSGIARLIIAHDGLSTLLLSVRFPLTWQRHVARAYSRQDKTAAGSFARIKSSFGPPHPEPPRNTGRRSF